MPRDENLAISSSKSIPPTPITSIMSAGLLRVLERKEGRVYMYVSVYVYVCVCTSHSPIQRSIIAYCRHHYDSVGCQLPHLIRMCETFSVYNEQSVKLTRPLAYNCIQVHRIEHIQSEH